MIYKTHKDAYLTTSERYGIDYDLVEKIGNFYWADISDRIANFKNRELFLQKLGTFRFRKLASLRFIKRIDRIGEMMRGNKRSEQAIEEAVKKAYLMKERMEPLIKEWEFIMQEYYKCREKKYAYRNLQEQKSNMGGVEKQDI